jgi:hypothetical protein
MPTHSRLASVNRMASRPGMGWRLAVVAGCVAPTIVLAGCSPTSSPATTTSAAPPTAATGIGDDYCSVVIKVNTDAGTMINKTFVPSTNWSRAQVAVLVDWTLGHRIEFLNITPPELKQAVEAEMLWMQAIKEAGYDLAAKAPAGTAEAMGKITNYNLTQCGISYG